MTISATTEFFAGQGPFLIGKNNGKGYAPGMRSIGLVDNGVSLGFSAEFMRFRETDTGDRFTVLRKPKTKDATIDLPLKSFSIQNLALAVWGGSIVIPAKTYVGEKLSTGIQPWQYGATRYQNVTAISKITDSAAAPVVLTQGSDYDIDNLTLGSIRFRDIASYTQPFQVNYNTLDSTSIPLFTNIPGEYWVRYHGINSASDDNEPVLVELYRVSFSPLDKLPLKEDDASTMLLKGELLYDMEAVNTFGLDPLLGGMGRVVRMKP